MVIMQNANYILLTAARNEEDNLPALISSIVRQTIKPALWVIVDDGSTDGTPAIIKEAKEKHKWIKSIRMDEHPRRDTGKIYARICNTGFDFAIKFCEEHNISYAYIGIVDADMVLEKDFFEKLIKEFKKNPKLGIASGSEYYYSSNNELVLEEVRDDLPMGCMRLWRKECFDETGGYYIGNFPDSVSNVSAKLKGWETRVFKHIKAIQARKTHSAEGLWKGYKVIGESDYFRDYHPLFVALKGLKYLCRNPYYVGIAYLYGYFSSILKRMDKIDNKEIRDYYRNKHREVARFYWTKIKNKLKRGNNEKM